MRMTVSIIESSLAGALRGLAATDAASRSRSMETLRLTLADPSRRKIAAKASRLKSLAAHAINTASGYRVSPRVDAAVPQILRLLHEAGVDVLSPGLLQTDACAPLKLAVQLGSETCVGALLELGADVGRANAAGETALLACSADSLRIVRQLIAAGAAIAAVLPAGGVQARLTASAAMALAIYAGVGCGECAARCGGGGLGNCADGLDILRALLAAGVREAVTVEQGALAAMPVPWLKPQDPAAPRLSLDHVLAILRALQAAGVDVLVRASAHMGSALDLATDIDDPALVRWLVREAGAPLEERDHDGLTPLARACDIESWAVAHELLDCGGSAAVRDEDLREPFRWPACTTAQKADSEGAYALLRRLLRADPGSLLRCTREGLSLVHAAVDNAPARGVLLDSRLPALAEAINRVTAVELPSAGGSRRDAVTPLHWACGRGRWGAALALLGAGARVDIAGDVGGARQTVAEWAARDAACAHGGLRAAIAARALEHASQGSHSGAAAAAHGGAASDGLSAGFAAAAASFTAAGDKKGATGSKARRGAASNRAETPMLDAPAALLPGAVAGPSAAPGAPVPAAAVAEVWGAGVHGVVPNTCGDPGAAAAAAHANLAETPASALLASVVHVEGSSVQVLYGGSALPPGPPAPAGGSCCCRRRPTGDAAGALGATGGFAEAPHSDGINPCEPSEVLAAAICSDAPSVNVCEPGEASRWGANSCEDGQSATARGAANIPKHADAE
jgi:ankyrin repeat protein